MSSKYRTTLNVKRLTEFRHDLHMHPELKFMEHRTSDKIAAFLTELDIPYKRGLASTGIVGSIYGKNRSANDPGPALGIRADIDALPLEEANKFTHASKHKGCMHGCGHDGHTAMLLGAAELLSANREVARKTKTSSGHQHTGSFRMQCVEGCLITYQRYQSRQRQDKTNASSDQGGAYSP